MRICRIEINESLNRDLTIKDIAERQINSKFNDFVDSITRGAEIAQNNLILQNLSYGFSNPPPLFFKDEGLPTNCFFIKNNIFDLVNQFACGDISFYPIEIKKGHSIIIYFLVVFNNCLKDSDVDFTRTQFGLYDEEHNLQRQYKLTSKDEFKKERIRTKYKLQYLKLVFKEDQNANLDLFSFRFNSFPYISNRFLDAILNLKYSRLGFEFCKDTPLYLNSIEETVCPEIKNKMSDEVDLNINLNKKTVSNDLLETYNALIEKIKNPDFYTSLMIDEFSKIIIPDIEEEFLTDKIISVFDYVNDLLLNLLESQSQKIDNQFIDFIEQNKTQLAIVQIHPYLFQQLHFEFYIHSVENRNVDISNQSFYYTLDSDYVSDCFDLRSFSSNAVVSQINAFIIRFDNQEISSYLLEAMDVLLRLNLNRVIENMDSKGLRNYPIAYFIEQTEKIEFIYLP